MLMIRSAGTHANALPARAWSLMSKKTKIASSAMPSNVRCVKPDSGRNVRLRGTASSRKYLTSLPSRLSARPSAKPLASTSQSGFSCAHITNWRWERSASSTATALEADGWPLLFVVASSFIAPLHLVDHGREPDAALDRFVAHERQGGRPAHAQAFAQLH